VFDFCGRFGERSFHARRQPSPRPIRTPNTGAISLPGAAWNAHDRRLLALLADRSRASNLKSEI
jgi:hypothetical protein